MDNAILLRDLFITFLPLLLYFNISDFERDYKHWCISEGTKTRRLKKRIPWSIVNERISDKQFRRMFRMTRQCFSELCQFIISKVGEKQFKSESYINAFLVNKDSMFIANEKTTGGYISGETKLGITLRLLAGGDSLDLGVIFDISPKWCNEIMYYVLSYWIISTNIGHIDIYRYLQDEIAMKKVSDGFAKRSNGIFIGTIGAIDGWLVRIIRPSFWRDGIKNITAFYSRKGFYALNVQCIVDDKKRVLWLSYSHKGGSHDSSCFRATKLYQYLKSLAPNLYEKGFYIIGDSAYCIESFILTPYDNALSKTSEDNYNFYQSSARITVECSFGEIDLRWGIFWKRLNCSLAHAAIIIEGSMRIHNYLVDFREREISDATLSTDNVIFNEDASNIGATPVQTGNDIGRPRGNISVEDRENRRCGLTLRDELRHSLEDHGMHRPSRDEWHSNAYNHTKRH